MKPDAMVHKVQELMQTNILALEAIIHYLSPNEEGEGEEGEEYWDKLKDAVLENILCMVHAYYLSNNYTTDGLMQASMQAADKYFVQLFGENMNPTLFTQKAVLNILLDYYAKYRRVELVNLGLIRHIADQLKLAPEQDEESQELLSRVQTIGL